MTTRTILSYTLCLVLCVCGVRVEAPDRHVASDWRPEHTGLVCAPTSSGVDGGSQWILPQYEALYAAGGAGLLQRVEVVYTSEGPEGVDSLLAAAVEEHAAGTLTAFLAAQSP